MHLLHIKGSVPERLRLLAAKKPSGSCIKEEVTIPRTPGSFLTWNEFSPVCRGIFEGRHPNFINFCIFFISFCSFSSLCFMCLCYIINVVHHRELGTGAYSAQHILIFLLCFSLPFTPSPSQSISLSFIWILALFVILGSLISTCSLSRFHSLWDWMKFINHYCLIADIYQRELHVNCCWAMVSSYFNKPYSVECPEMAIASHSI